MFRKKGPNDGGSTTLSYSEEEVANPSYRPRTVSFSEERSHPHHAQENEIPPRIFDTSEPVHTSRPPVHRHQNSELPSAPREWKGASLVGDEPEAVLGEGISIKGELSFERFLRIDGAFEGKLISEGKIHVGPTGHVKSNITLREAIIEGNVEGDISVEERLELRGEARVVGSIKAKLLSIDEGVTIDGHIAVTPFDAGS